MIVDCAWRKRVALDIDGVVLNLLEGLRLMFEKDGKTFYPEKVEDYGFHGDIGVDRKEVFEAFKHKEVYGLAPLYAGVEDYIKKLRCCADVVPYTVVSNNLDVVEERLQLLKSLGFDTHRCNIYTGGTKPVLEDVNVLIEDCLETCIDWINHGFSGEIFLIDHTYNRNVPEEYVNRIVRCNGFIDAVERCVTYGI